jgi:gas vesicle protein
MTDLRTALESAFSEDEASNTPVDSVHNTPEPVSTDKPLETTAEQRARDEAGRFAAKKTGDQAPQDDLISPATPQEEKPIKAPSSWKPAAQEAYLKAERGEPLTPEEVRILTNEANRRESDFHRGVEEFKTHAQKARAYEAAIAPYQQTLQSIGVDAPTAISALLKADHTLRYSDPATKAQYFQQLAQQYGIDLQAVQNAPQVDPQTQYLMNQLNELRQTQQQWHNSIQQQEQTRANQELEQFNNAGNAHFEAVRDEMADLLETGKATSLQDAYEKAVWMNPDIRQSLIEQQRLDAQKKATAEAQAIRAKTAAVSVKGSSPSAGGVQTNGSDLRSLIASQFG